jgi:hypothetical protein
MPPTQADSRGPKIPGAGAGRRHVSWATVLLGAALLACALALYLYASSNTPHNYNDSDNLDNINRATPGAGDTRPTPDASAQPSKTPEPKGDARTPR